MGAFRFDHTFDPLIEHSKPLPSSRIFMDHFFLQQHDHLTGQASNFGPALAFALTALVVNTLGLVIVARKREWAERNSLWFAAFAVGVLITTSLGHLIPEALEHTSQALIYVPIGAGALALISYLISKSSTNPQSNPNTPGIASVIGIGFHSLMDGVAYSTTFYNDILSGVLTALGLVLHEIPEGIIAFTLLRAAGTSTGRAFIIAFLLTAATTPLGMTLSYPFMALLEGKLLGNILAVTAGGLIYVAFVHLLPRLKNKGSANHIVAIVAGSFTALSAILLSH